MEGHKNARKGGSESSLAGWLLGLVYYQLTFAPDDSRPLAEQLGTLT